VQKVREAANRARCANNLKQIALATHNLCNTYEYLPPLCAPDGWTAITVAAPPYRTVNYTVFNWLLPFVEQDAVYRRQSWTAPTPAGGAGYSGGMYMVPVKTYICPADSSHLDGMCGTTNGQANLFAGTSYAANYYVFGNPNDTRGDTYRVQGANLFPSSIVDGTSNTIFFTEVFVTCGLTGSLSSAGANLWADSTTPWRPIFCHNTSNKSTNAGYAACNMFQVQPQYFTTCDPSRPQSPHIGGINCCLGDGSVRFVSSSISTTTWAQACDPRDGAVLGSDW
jgi:hypothetical protein